MRDPQPIEECASVRGELCAWMDGELGPEQQAAVEQHLAACSACRAEAALLRLVSQAVRQVPSLEPREELRRRVLHQVRAEVTREPAAARHPHGVDIRVTERAGEYVIHWQERGASPAPIRTPLPEWFAGSTSPARVQWQQQGSGGLTISCEVIEVG